MKIKKVEKEKNTCKTTRTYLSLLKMCLLGTLANFGQHF